MIRLALDLTKRDIGVIFDIKTGVRMTPKNPLASVPFLTDGIKRSIESGKIIDIDNVSGLNVSEKDSARHDRVLSMLGITRNIKEVEPAELVVEESKEEVKEEVEEVKAKNSKNKQKKDKEKEDKVDA